jgi:hypothetical protein
LDAFIISSLPSRLTETLQTAGPLHSADVTPLLRYYGPIRHPLAFDRFPGLAGYTVYLAPDNFSPGRGGLLQLLGMSLSPCCRCRPAEVKVPQPDFGTPCCLRPCVVGSALRSSTFEATFTFTFVTARQLVASPRETSSIGFKILVSRHLAIQTTGRLTFAPTGLTPAEHTSLFWTHNAACRFLALRSPVCFTPRFMGPILLERLSALGAEPSSR